MSERGFVYDYIGARDPTTYELESTIADPEQLIEHFMYRVYYQQKAK